jgi:hypothetical protein
VKFDGMQLDDIVNQLQSDHDVSLSTAARHSLLAPVLEAQSFGSEVTNEQVRNSLNLIIGSSAGLVDPLTGNNRQITSLAINQAIHLNFCNVPPFCSPLVKFRGGST